MNDLISRQTVLRCIKESRDNIDWGQSEDGDAFLHYTGALYRTIASEEYLPSAQRKGKWINKNGIINCSICRCCSWSLSFGHLVKSFNFCPNCGASMVRGEEDE